MNDQEMTFSILMANYNNSQYIEEAIGSVLDQTYPFWELIIVDDNSSDESVEIITKYIYRENVILITHDKNLGYGGSLRTAAMNANNEILCILDADDKLDKSALEIMAKAYQKFPESGFIYSKMWICDSNLENCVIPNGIGPIKPKKGTIFNHRVFHLKTFRKEIYEKTTGFEISQKRSVDKDIIYKLEEHTKFKYINFPLYYYRKHQGGISQFTNKPEAFFYHYLAKIKTYQRRLGTELPNFSKGELYKDYFIITFKNLILVRKKFFKWLRIDDLIQKLFKRYPKLIYSINMNLRQEPFKSLFQSLL